MGTTPVCVVSSTGISRPTFATVLAWAVSQFQAIYGSDVNLDSSTQDGEMVGLLATAIDDTNAMAVQAYNAFSPATAMGTGLSSVVKINGIARLTPSFSTAPMLVVGVAGTIITSGRVADVAGFVWDLPARVTIPLTGQIAVSATCETIGAVSAPIATINQIVNTQPGWQTASNFGPAAAGNPVESDAQLRIRQAQSTMNASTAIAQGLEGALLALPGVARCRVYDNEGDAPDGNNIPGHSLAVVIDGGNVQQIAQTIKAQKGGCGTYGYSSQTVVDAYGVQSQVNYFSISEPQITVGVAIVPLTGFTTDAVGQIQTAVAAYINSVGIGNYLTWTRLYGVIYGVALGQTFEIIQLAIARDGNALTSSDVQINFFEAPFCESDFVSVTVVD